MTQENQGRRKVQNQRHPLNRISLQHTANNSTSVSGGLKIPKSFKDEMSKLIGTKKPSRQFTPLQRDMMNSTNADSFSKPRFNMTTEQLFSKQSMEESFKEFGKITPKEEKVVHARNLSSLMKLFKPADRSGSQTSFQRQNRRVQS